MNIIKTKTIFKIGILILACQAYFTHAEKFKAEFPKYHSNQSSQIKKITSLGIAQLNHGIKVPVYLASIENPYGGGGLVQDEQICKKNQCQFNFNLSKQNHTQFKIMIFPSIGTILIPKDWNMYQLSIGASSVASLQIYNLQQDEMIHIENTASCGGCSMYKASLYFPEVKKLSLKNEFGVIEDKDHALKIVKVNKNKVYFSYQIPNYPNKTHGIAFYADENDGNGYTNFQEIKVTLKPENQAWATEILNFYQATH